MPSHPMTARKAALFLLNSVLTQHRLLSEALGDARITQMAPSDRATAQRLVTGCLRHLGRCDRLIQPLTPRKPQAFVQNVLRLGTYELALGGQAHGVVNEYVTLTAGHKKYTSAKGMVNAVLRKLADTAPAKWPELPPSRLPRWLRDPLTEAYGKRAATAFDKAHSQTPPVDLTVKSDPQKWADTLGGTLTPFGSVRLAEHGQISALDGFAEGAWWVQDAAAALPAKLLDMSEGMSVLDMCAAPGGKTLQLAAIGAHVTALDASETRATRIQENLERTGLSATVIVQDALDHHGSYDAILLDAPCSATGTIRRHPDLPYAKDGSGFGDLMALQSEMLRHAAQLLRVGGQLAYCTCSLLPDEGECQIEEFLAEHPTFTARPLKADQFGIDPKWITEDGGLRLRPDYWAEIGGMDGFYVTVLQKSA